MNEHSSLTNLAYKTINVQTIIINFLVDFEKINLTSPRF